MPKKLVLATLFVMCWPGIAQTVLRPTPAPQAHFLNCQSDPDPTPSRKTFDDPLSGFRFEYPGYLTLSDPSLTFENPPCAKPFSFGGSIQIEVSLPAHYREPYYGHREDLAVDTRDLNGLHWKHYRTGADARFCTFAAPEQVCIFAADTSPQHQLPERVVEAMAEIESSFAFTDPAKRMDARIAAIRVGTRMGTLTVRKVVTQDAMKLNRRAYPYEGFGAIDFAGTLTLRGEIEDIGTMNSRGQYRIIPSTEAGPQLPLDLDDKLGPGIAIDYSQKFEDTLKQFDDGNTELTLVLRNLRVIVGPPGAFSEVTAQLVSIAPAR